MRRRKLKYSPICLSVRSKPVDPRASSLMVPYVAACPRLRASEAMTRSVTKGSRLWSGALSWHTAVRYSRAIVCASRALRSSASGQPPLHASSTSRCVSSSTMAAAGGSSKSRARETMFSESPDSESVMGDILMRPIRPAPLCRLAASASPCRSGGVDDPVRIQPPRRPRVSSMP